MSGLDIEGVLVTHHHLDRLRGLCMNQQGAPCGWEGVGPEEWRAHVAAVLREQIAVAQVEAWERGWADAQRSRMSAPLPHENPYRAAESLPEVCPAWPDCDELAVDSGEGRFCGQCQDYEGTCANDHCLTCGAST